MKKVGIGVIGAGGIARRKTIPALQQAKNCQVVAVMDVVGANEIASELKISRAYTQEADLLADPAVEAVYIATPVYLHNKQIRMAAEKGKHILCEKPLTLTLEEAKDAIAVCKQNKVFLQEGYMMKFHGAHQTIKEIIASGRLGKIVYLRAQLSCWYPPIKDAWRQNPKKGGGGALFDMATHLYDLLEHFAGPIHRVAAFTNTLVQSYQSDDASTTLLEFKSGAQATVDCFYCIPDEASRTRLEIYGSQGSIFTEGTIGQSVDGAVEGILSLGAGGYDAAQNKDVARTFQKVDFPRVNPYTAEFEYFADCVLNGCAPKINTGENAYHVMDIAQKAYTASKENRILMA
ncbi:MAG: Gfo/Idh/MocA family oxidoreductase [Planctomycetota bacterium]